MPNRHKTKLKSTIIDSKLNQLRRKLEEQGLTEDKATIIGNALDEIKRHLANLNKPIFKANPLDPSGPIIETDIISSFKDIDKDFDVLYQEARNIADNLVGNFNNAQSMNISLKNRMKELNSLVNEYKLLEGQAASNIIHITDNFNTKESVDINFSSSTKAHISTDEGIARLKHNESINQSLGAEIDYFNGNGELGNYRIVNPDVLHDNTNTLSKNMFFLSYENSHDNLDFILDNKPDTWIEYQMINIPFSKKEEYYNYDLTWAKGKEIGDKLRARIVIKLPSETTINWININPYLPHKYTSSKIIVHNISTSIDGFEYRPIYEDSIVLNSRLNILPDTYNALEISDEDFSRSKFASQGVWNFSPRRARYIEVILDQDESHPEDIGLVYYDRIIYQLDNAGNTLETRIKISEESVSDNIKDSLPGMYSVGQNTYISKNIDVTRGWRYTIGVRDINIYSNTFAETSELISERFSLDKPIRAISLDVSEKIPAEILSLIKDRNNWIRYYISLNDVDWYPISPTSHRQVGTNIIPPKVYLINNSINPTIEINRGYIEMQDTPSNIRIKVLFSRPNDIEDANSYTPILENYTLRIVTEE